MPRDPPGAVGKRGTFVLPCLVCCLCDPDPQMDEKSDVVHGSSRTQFLQTINTQVKVKYGIVYKKFGSTRVQKH